MSEAQRLENSQRLKQALDAGDLLSLMIIGDVHKKPVGVVSSWQVCNGDDVIEAQTGAQATAIFRNLITKALNTTEV